MKKRFLCILSALVFVTGCNLPIKNEKIGQKCDDIGTINLVESILNNDMVKKGDINISVDKNAIVEWDYKDGKYLCKAKIEGSYSDKLGYFDKLMLMNYGIRFKNHKTSGWVYYETYLTTKDMKKLKDGKTYSFYVKLIEEKNFPIF